jgi:hypothetical protein
MRKIWDFAKSPTSSTSAFRTRSEGLEMSKWRRAGTRDDVARAAAVAAQAGWASRVLEVGGARY